LGIPTVKDRVVQMAALLVLAPIFEADFHPNSFGFRPRCNAHQALKAIIEALRAGKLEVVDADLSKYFETIPHRKLMQLLAKRISDGAMLHLLRQWLEASVVEEEIDGSRPSPAEPAGRATRRGHLAAAGQCLSQRVRLGG
jgi:RNA-directed DNA polymerase